MNKLDLIDKKIIALLHQDSRLTNKQIGKVVHRTGQAIGVRINTLVDLGIIQRYTINMNYPDKQFIHLFLNSPKFVEVEHVLSQFDQIDAIYKTAGSACYTVIAHFSSQEISVFIEQISVFCRYSINSVVKIIKD